MSIKIEDIQEIIKENPSKIALPILYTVQTKNGELGIRLLPKLTSKLYQTDKFLFRKPNHKKII